MDAKERAAYLIDKGYIKADSYLELADKIEAAEIPEHTHITSPSTIIEYSQKNFVFGIDKIVAYIKADRWEPDYIVGLVRGGAVPAVYLSHKLKVPVQMIRWNTRDETNWENDSASGIAAQIPLDINCNGKKILLVDDIVDGGDTINEVLTDWNKACSGDLNLDNIRVCAMVYNIAQTVKVDYYDVQIDRNQDKRWVVFPWE